MMLTGKLALTLFATLTAAGALATWAESTRDASTQSTPELDYHQEIFYAVLEGLYADGVQNEAVDVLLATEDGRPAHFVQGCPICMPAIDALTVYRARPPFANKARSDTFGSGLTDDQLRELRSPDRARRLEAVTALVERWVERRLRARRLTETEHAAWTRAMEERRKKGMAMLAQARDRALEKGELSPALDMQRCAFCDGANDACER